MNKIYNHKVHVWECSECGYQGFVEVKIAFQENKSMTLKKWKN